MQLDAAWREMFNLSERHNHGRFTTKETEHQREVAALRAENQSLKARLNHERCSESKPQGGPSVSA